MSEDEDELLTVTLNQNRNRLTPNRMMRMPPVPSEQEKDNKEYLTLRVVRPSQEQDNVEIHFRVKRTTQMGKLKRSYSDRVGVEVSSLRFLYDGRRISDDATPGFLEMESGDYIEVYRELGVNLSAQEPLEVNMTGDQMTSRERNYDEVSGSSENIRRSSRVNDECEPSQSKKLKFSLDSIQSSDAAADNSGAGDNSKNNRDDELNEVKAQLAEVTKKYEDFVKKLRDKVECPVCFEVPKCAPVPVCPNGHVVCVRCVRDTCPTCRVRMGAATSTLAVTVIENILHTCEHDTCGAVMPLRAMLRHVSRCPHRPVTCPGLDCSTRVSFSGLVSHVVTCCVERSEIREYKLPHKFSFMMNEDLKNLTGESQNFNWKLEGVKFDNKVFLLKVTRKARTGRWFFCAQMVGCEEDALCYSADITVFRPDHGPDGKYSQRYSGDVCPIDVVSVDAADEAGYCLTLRDGNMSKFILKNSSSGENEFSVYLNINKVS